MKTQINYRKNIVRTIHYYKRFIKYHENEKVSAYEDDSYYDDRKRMIDSAKAKILLLEELLQDQRHTVINFHEYDY